MRVSMYFLHLELTFTDKGLISTSVHLIEQVLALDGYTLYVVGVCTVREFNCVYFQQHWKFGVACIQNNRHND